MCENTNYIYLLQEREFLKTKENIFKVGMTTKLNHKRFNQYPKSSILLFQIICQNCKDIEKIIIEKFKNIFKIRKDIGNEYFEGDYLNMIDIIYTTVKQENNNIINNNNLSNEKKSDEYILIEEFQKDFEITNNDLDFIKSIRLREWSKIKKLNIYTSKSINKILNTKLNYNTNENLHKKSINGNKMWVLLGIKEK
jgi:hypothetical protein